MQIYFILFFLIFLKLLIELRFLIISEIVIVSCKSVDTTLVGNYKTHNSTNSEKWINYISNKCVVLGVEL